MQGKEKEENEQWTHIFLLKRILKTRVHKTRPWSHIFIIRVFYYNFAGPNTRLLKMQLEVAFWGSRFLLIFCRNEYATRGRVFLRSHFLHSAVFYKNFLTFQKLCFYPNYSKCILGHFFAKVFNARTCKTIKTCILTLINKLKTTFTQIEG